MSQANEEYAAIRGLVRRLMAEGYTELQVCESFSRTDQRYVAKALAELTGQEISAPPPPRRGREKRNATL